MNGVFISEISYNDESLLQGKTDRMREKWQAKREHHHKSSPSLLPQQPTCLCWFISFIPSLFFLLFFIFQESPGLVTDTLPVQIPIFVTALLEIQFSASLTSLFQHVLRNFWSEQNILTNHAFGSPLLRRNLPFHFHSWKYAHILECIISMCSTPSGVYFYNTHRRLSWGTNLIVYGACWYLVGSVQLVEVWLSGLHQLHNS